MPRDRAQLTLEIELDSEPITGALTDAERITHPYSGWIELVSLIQAAATTTTPDADQPPALALAPRPEEVT